MRFEKFAALIEVKGYHGNVWKRVGDGECCVGWLFNPSVGNTLWQSV
jgi:hypothetical protein